MFPDNNVSKMLRTLSNDFLVVGWCRGKHLTKLERVYMCCYSHMRLLSCLFQTFQFESELQLSSQMIMRARRSKLRQMTSWLLVGDGDRHLTELDWVYFSCYSHMCLIAGLFKKFNFESELQMSSQLIMWAKWSNLKQMTSFLLVSYRGRLLTELVRV